VLHDDVGYLCMLLFVAVVVNNMSSGRTRVFLGRIPHIARESDVERFFKGYGKIREISLKDGYGFVVGCSWPDYCHCFISH